MSERDRLRAPQALAVLLVEDDGFTRSTLSAALQRHGFVVTAVATTREALAIADLPPVAVLDLDLGPGPTGIDLAVALRDREPTIGLVLLTTYDDPRLMDTSLPALPRGIRYLRKRDVEHVAEVVLAIEDVTATPLAMRPRNTVPLTESQLQILSAVAEGLSTREIARRRDVSEKAVEAAITRLCEYFHLERDVAHNQRVRLAAEYHLLAGRPPR